MSTHAVRTTGRFRGAAVGIFVASAIAVSALAVQARSVLSTTTKIQAPTTERVDPYASKDAVLPQSQRKHGVQSAAADRPLLRAGDCGEEVGPIGQPLKKEMREMFRSSRFTLVAVIAVGAGW